MSKKTSGNKYGLSSIQFNQPGFSLAMPKVNLVEKPQDKTTGADKKTVKKSAATKTSSSTKVASVKGTKQKVIARKPTMMRKAGRSK